MILAPSLKIENFINEVLQALQDGRMPKSFFENQISVSPILWKVG